MNEGEAKLIKDFMESMGSRWTNSVLKSCDDSSLSKCCMILLRCGILEFTISSLFQAIEERKKFISRRGDIICNLFAEGIQVDDIDRIVSALFSGIEDVQSYTKEYAEKNGFAFCGKFLYEGDWKTTMDFVQWSFESEEEIICFYHNFFRSGDFYRLFNTKCWLKKSSETLVSLIKANNILGRQFSSELIFEVFLSMLSYNHFLFLDRKRKINESEALFDAFDAILLACFQDDQNKLNDFKKGALTDKEKKMYISFPQEYLNRHVDVWRNTKHWENRVEDVWHEMVEDFFNWICSSDEKLRSN